jgi:K+-sensing histidine kinase KdpD
MSVATMALPTRSRLGRIGRKKFDPQPTQHSAVLIATNGEPVSAAVVRRAVELSDGEPVAVVTLARIYGSALGLPNPGLMPSKVELADHRELVDKVVRRLERRGVAAWGQIAATRKPRKTIVAAARARGVRHVIVVTPEQPRWRQLVEGDLVHDVERRLPDDVTVERGTA